MLNATRSPLLGLVRRLLPAAELAPLQEASSQFPATQDSNHPCSHQQADLHKLHAPSQTPPSSTQRRIGGASPPLMLNSFRCRGFHSQETTTRVASVISHDTPRQVATVTL